jgi:two-component SAPR family response regulator
MVSINSEWLKRFSQEKHTLLKYDFFFINIDLLQVRTIDILENMSSSKEANQILLDTFSRFLLLLQYIASLSILFSPFQKEKKNLSTLDTNSFKS